MNLVASENAPVRDASAELAMQRPAKTLAAAERLPQLVLPGRHDIRREDIRTPYLEKILAKTYERAQEDFETLLGMPGVGEKRCHPFPVDRQTYDRTIGVLHGALQRASGPVRESPGVQAPCRLRRRAQVVGGG